MSETNNKESEVFHLVYVSTATKQLDIGEIRNIENTSQKNNQDAQVTGILMFRDGKFMQFLEGSENEVKRVFSKIEQDPRHSNIHVIRQGTIPRRQFSDWHMKYTPLSEIQYQEGIIYNKLFELTTRAKEIVASAEESMSLLIAFKFYALV